MDAQLIGDILTVCRRMDAKGLVNAFEGNISALQDGFIYITPSGKNKAFLDEGMIAVLEEQSLKQMGGKFPPSSELLLHTQSYKARADIKAVIHCHAPYLTAFALNRRPVKSRAYPEMMHVFKKIPVASYGRPGTADIFTGVAELIEKHNAVLLANHGVLVLGRDIYDAMNRIEACESIARVLFLAESIGKPVDLPEEECAYLLSK
jgi:L-fuculose-phosphate aldolase